MDRKPEDLSGMSAAEAKECIFHFVSALKLAEKNQGALALELEKWNSRRDLALSRGAADLAAEADKAAARIRAEADAAAVEILELKDEIDAMRRQLPGLAARERSVDPDLLEQELLLALGRSPGDETQAAERDLENLEREAAAGAALEALKAKMGASGGDGAP
jgi:hypothetical protein